MEVMSNERIHSRCGGVPRGAAGAEVGCLGGAVNRLGLVRLACGPSVVVLSEVVVLWLPAAWIGAV